uniref:Uncharacterized protein n=1 Tax=Glossina palpalis gambiensis TaxID=67801 RepID=A0A1B0B772_9MUSC
MTALLLFELEFEDKVTSFSSGAKEAFAVGVIFVNVDVACCGSLLTVTLGRKRISTSPFMEVDGAVLEGGCIFNELLTVADVLLSAQRDFRCLSLLLGELVLLPLLLLAVVIEDVSSLKWLSHLNVKHLKIRKEWLYGKLSSILREYEC